MKVCLFSSYRIGAGIPYFVQEYLSELRRHFNRIIFVTNDDFSIDQEATSFLEGLNCKIVYVKNEGFDFGMWSKVINDPVVSQAELLGLVNDSCVLFAPLDSVIKAAESSTAAMYGITESYVISHHIQSYFLLIKKRGIATVQALFNEHGVIRDDIRSVIVKYEIGLSEKVKLAVDGGISAYYKVNQNFPLSPCIYYAEDIIKNGGPVIKRRALKLDYDDYHLKIFLAANKNPDPDYFLHLFENIYSLSGDRIDRLFGPDFALKKTIPIELRFKVKFYKLMGIKRKFVETAAQISDFHLIINKNA